MSVDVRDMGAGVVEMHLLPNVGNTSEPPAEHAHESVAVVDAEDTTLESTAGALDNVGKGTAVLVTYPYLVVEALAGREYSGRASRALVDQPNNVEPEAVEKNYTVQDDKEGPEASVDVGFANCLLVV